MRTEFAYAIALVFAACASPSDPELRTTGSDSHVVTTEWSMNATIIEACSCPMFCQCYFNTEPAEHPGCCPPGASADETPRYCRFSNAYQVNEGSYGDVDLKGATFWMSGDLGADFTAEKLPWARLHFDPSVSEAQREGILAVLPVLYPVKWDSFEVGEDFAVEWTKGEDRSVAKLDGGAKGEVILERSPGMSDDPVVIQNLRYWGAPRNDGFVLMKNEVVSYSVGDQSYEYRGTNGFMITFDVNSTDATGKSY